MSQHLGAHAYRGDCLNCERHPDPIDNTTCNCGRAWEGHPNPHSIICPLHEWPSNSDAAKEKP